MNFDYSPEFQKDLKRLTKKWRSLPRDIESVERDILPLFVEQKGVDIIRLREAFFGGYKAAVLMTTADAEVIKMRLDCESLGTNSKTRLVFVAVKTEGTIRFVELYAKNEKAREDLKRIKKYLPET